MSLLPINLFDFLLNVGIHKCLYENQFLIFLLQAPRSPLCKILFVVESEELKK